MENLSPRQKFHLLRLFDQVEDLNPGGTRGLIEEFVDWVNEHDGDGELPSLADLAPQLRRHPSNCFFVDSTFPQEEEGEEQKEAG